MDEARQPTHRTGSVPVALMLAGVAGQLDALVYLNHGHVFATAMTGNTVLLGVAAVSGNLREVVHHAAPIFAFVAGALTARWLRHAIPTRAHMLSLVFEAAALVIAGLLPPTFPPVQLVLWIAFVAAVQVETFRRIGPFDYSSTFVTGDLRDISESLHDVLALRTGAARRCAARARLRDLSLVWLCFLGGAALGAFTAPRLHDDGFWVPLPLLGCAVVAELVRQARNKAPSTRHARTGQVSSE